MRDHLHSIGSAGPAGRGNNSTSPSSAARGLAPDGSARRRKPRKAAQREGSAHLRAVRESAEGAQKAERETAAAEEEAAEFLDESFSLDQLLEAIFDGLGRMVGESISVDLDHLIHVVRERLAGNYGVDDFGLDPQLVSIAVEIFEPLAEKWFRLQVRGVENIPVDGGALLVSNHSGTIPVDGLMTGYAVKKYANRHLRPLGADLMFQLPYVSQLARKMGATLACGEDAERLLTSGELAAVWPEGFKGVGKPFSERYKLQRFGRGGFVSSAMRAQVPIIPVSVVGAEEIYPLIGNIPSLARLLGLPYLPITPFFPWLGLLGMVPLPSKWIIEFGEPIRTDAYEPDAADDPMLLFNLTDQVRETIQQTLYQLLVERGSAFF